MNETNNETQTIIDIKNMIETTKTSLHCNHCSTHITSGSNLQAIIQPPYTSALSGMGRSMRLGAINQLWVQTWKNAQIFTENLGDQ